jgi:isopentenyl diphosphate isomerase/L-lactate dehydrogenase-like FMN-dependent dehydrogenase
MRYDEILESAHRKMKANGLFEAMTFQGTETGYTRLSNDQFFKTIALKLRTIDTVPADTRARLFGRELNTPIIAGAMSRPAWKMENCLTAWAKGVKEAGSIMGAGIVTSKDFVQIMKTGAPTYRISKPFKEREKIVEIFREAERLGALAVGTDIDFVLGQKAGDRIFHADEMAPLSCKELEGLRKETGLPFIVKGILHEDDARKSLDIGADAVVVSNHRGVVMDYCAHPLEVLPLIRRAVGSEMTILADSGFMRGSDVLKALALGADGVLVGQAILLGAIAAGEAGVRDVLMEMTGQLQRAMTLTGCPDLASVDGSILVRRGLIFA